MDSNYYDYLTGLPTMTYFFEFSASRKAAIIENSGQPVLLFITLNGFKPYNQKHGFAEGNELLKSFASILSQHFNNENCCRLGGVHFATITDERSLETKLQSFIENCKSLDSDFGIYPHIGVYQYSNEEVSINVACDRAKLASDGLKNEHTAGIKYYNQAIKHAEEKHRYITENLNKAISERWITVYYQPIVRAVNGKVCDEEALARWVDPVKGFLSPGDFIPILEEEKLIYKLDLYVLERVLEKMKHFESLGITAVSHSINLSRSDFEVCDIVEEVRTRVDISGIPRSKINIEITESVIGSDFDFMMKQIIRFKELGFSVWMDDFGSGYSSLNVLRDIPFDLIKFDMSFMRNFDKEDNGKLILAELMKMAFTIDVDTICEGVETEEQLQFLKEIGCSKIQGYYYCRPIPIEEIISRIEKKINIGFENPQETHYYETIGRVNLQDLTVLSYGNEKDFSNIYDMLPLAIIELTKDSVRFVRTNQSYRNFFQRFFGMGITGKDIPVHMIMQTGGGSFFGAVSQVAKDGNCSFVDDTLPDGSLANYFIRKLTENLYTETIALAVGVLSIKAATQGTTYANIAKALAADYFDIFYVDMESGEFTEYKSIRGEEIMTKERHGNDFFEEAHQAIPSVIYEDDRDIVLNKFSKEKIQKELEEHGTFALTYRLVSEDGTPFYANLKIMRMNHKGRFVVVAVSNIDSQVKQQIELDEARQEQIAHSRLLSLSGDFLAMYVVDPETEEFTEYSSASSYDEFNLPKHGTDFFAETRKNAEKALHPDDVAGFQKVFTKENILSEIDRRGLFTFYGRLMLSGEATPYSVRISKVKENGEDKLIVGTRL